MESPFAANPRLHRQILFLGELDKLKDILRRSLVEGTRRRENSAEHSWHLAMMALILLEHMPNAELDQLRIIKMLLVHDIVEIDAGDTFCYDTTGYETKAAREQAAAARIFNLLPPDQATDIRALWDEFETGATPEAKIANAFDRLQPILQNLRTGLETWREHRVTKAQVLAHNGKIAAALPEIWTAITALIEHADTQGHFHKADS